MELLIDIVLLTFLAITALAISHVRKLFCAIMLASIFSLLCACLFVTMDAVDVAFTEAAVGTGIAGILMLGALRLTETREKRPPHQPWLALLVVCTTGAVLIYGTADLPAYGDPAAPIHQHVAPRYISQSQQEVGPPNFVTSVLASYRGFDTLGETLVIFTAGVSVVALLDFRSLRQFLRNRRRPSVMADHLVLRIVAKMFIPLILLFALYVQFHGDYGPGGGFQAGVIFASALILYTLTYGLAKALQVLPPRILYLLAAGGVLLYGGTGWLCVLRGGHFLDYRALASDPLVGQHLGILLIEAGVGMTVFAVMVLMFFAFSSRKEPQL
ncbi:DUF4040 domain-containing protein [Desulfuromonas thiophila]|uniref:Multisubunit sodium/proton antiporter, MrpB subunit (TC 2.A.63.1) n=1 Tax=Desulfuromonas thiophila TaxID=57664 RepID=A0A1G6ZST2_9BACT|nr:DUF4040 domain-containing protein [Desulfuromonas thiophila]SDE05748.1 multisubunit sodium/proton antiporter, MrpB subunit (TC 2.A.63.1) [Desulfuromonas thiophila]